MNTPGKQVHTVRSNALEEQWLPRITVEPVIVVIVSLQVSHLSVTTIVTWNVRVGPLRCVVVLHT